jgi:hypothetical protein
MESRVALSGGTVIKSGEVVLITPASTGNNTASVSYANVKGTTELEVTLNGSPYLFSLSSVGFVYYEGAGSSGNTTFGNSTSLHTVTYAGSGDTVVNSTGTGADEVIGSTGSVTLNCGRGPDVLIGGTSSNMFNENPLGSGVFVENGNANTVNGDCASYVIYT